MKRAIAPPAPSPKGRARRRVRFGLGIDRLTMEVLGLTNVREAVLFPRDRTRLAP